MAETDNNRYSGSKRVNMKILGGVPSFHQNLSRGWGGGENTKTIAIPIS